MSFKTRLARRASALALLPTQEFAEQRLPLLLRHPGSLRFRRPDNVTTGPPRIDGLGGTDALEHLLRRRPAGPARNARRQIDVAPFRMAWRLAELVPLGEQAFD